MQATDWVLPHGTKAIDWPAIFVLAVIFFLIVCPSNVYDQQKKLKENLTCINYTAKGKQTTSIIIYTL